MYDVAEDFLVGGRARVSVFAQSLAGKPSLCCGAVDDNHGPMPSYVHINSGERQFREAAISIKDAPAD
jgi:hypothetical protein